MENFNFTRPGTIADATGNHADADDAMYTTTCLSMSAGGAPPLVVFDLTRSLVLVGKE